LVRTKNMTKGFQKVLVCADAAFPLITFLDADIVVSPSDIQLVK